MRKRLMVLILVLGVLFAPAVAFADDIGGSDGGDFSDRVIYGPNVLNIQSGTYGVQVYAGNKFNAALCVLGFDGNDSRFTNDVKAYLSNESTGGSFYEFSNLFTNNNSPNIGGFDAYNITFTSAIGTNNTLYGAEFVWIAKYTDTLRQAAYARVEEVLNGNTGGGGSSTPLPDDGNYKIVPVQLFDASLYSWNITGDTIGSTYVPDAKYNQTYKLGSDSYYLKQYSRAHNASEGSPFSVNISSALITKLMQRLRDVGWSDGAFLITYDASSDYYSIGLRLVHKDSLSKLYDMNGYFVGFGYDSSKEFALHFLSNNKLYYPNSWPNSVSELNSSLLKNDTNVTQNSMQTGYTNFLSTYDFGYSLIDLDGSVGDEPVVPPTQWPEPDPVTPTEPPVVPDPPSSDPVSDPTNVNIGIPQLPNIGLTIEPTYGTADLSAVLDAMAKHCQHLQSCMIDCFDDFYSSITQFEKSLQENTKEFQRSWFRVILDTIRDCFDDLSDYLQTLFTWLADQMDFTFTGGDYDDSSILWWLKRIYSKLGSGTTVKPTDPVVDPKGIGDWFDQLIKNFVLDLLALGQDFLADVVEMFRQLTTKFPISIPWDIVAILTLFAAEPETPVLNIPQYALTGANTISQVGTYVIDLQDYDGVMSVVRNVEKVVFAFWLCWKIDFFKQAFDIMTGGK